MLLRFAATNHLSIRDRQELSLVSSSLSDRADGLIQCASSPSGTVLPAVLVYGANASGKSNLADAISSMRESVLFSHTRIGPDGGIPSRQPFRLDRPSEAIPSVFVDRLQSSTVCAITTDMKQREVLSLANG